MNTNVIMEKLYTFQGSRAAGNTSYEEKNEAIDRFKSLFKNKNIKKITIILFTTTISEFKFYEENNFS